MWNIGLLLEVWKYGVVTDDVEYRAVNIGLLLGVLNILLCLAPICYSNIVLHAVIQVVL